MKVLILWNVMLHKPNPQREAFYFPLQYFQEIMMCKVTNTKKFAYGK